MLYSLEQKMKMKRTTPKSSPLKLSLMMWSSKNLSWISGDRSIANK